jgi:hypothetical protein
MATMSEVVQLALGLSERERMGVVASLLASLPPVLSDSDEGVVEALRRDAELGEHPERALSLEQLESHFRPQR